VVLFHRVYLLLLFTLQCVFVGAPWASDIRPAALEDHFILDSNLKRKWAEVTSTVIIFQ